MFVKPTTFRQRLSSRLMRILLQRVDHFIHYFKDLDGYQRYFGIGPERSSFVPFKVNSWDRVPPADELSSDGDFIFTGGRSLRDVDTFLAAMRRVRHPGVLLYHDLPRMAENGTPLDLANLPANVRAMEDDGSADSWLEQMRRGENRRPHHAAEQHPGHRGHFVLDGDGDEEMRHHHRRPGDARHPERRGDPGAAWRSRRVGRGDRARLA